MTEIVIGIATGSVYALVALGYNMTYLAAGVVNFAHANLMVVGMFVAYALYSFEALPLWLSLPFAFVVAAAIGFIQERLTVRPIANQSSSAELVTMVGVATLLTGSLILFFGSDALRVPFFGAESVHELFGVRIDVVNVVIIGVAVGMAVILELITRRTKVGLAALAQTDDPEAAQLRGINVRGLALYGFVLAAGVGGMLGPLLVAKTFAASSIAIILAVKGFVVLVLGGVGSHWGVLTAAFGIGIVEALGARYLGPSYRDIVVFVVFAAFLLILPGGIAGRRKARTV